MGWGCWETLETSGILLELNILAAVGKAWLVSVGAVSLHSDGNDKTLRFRGSSQVSIVVGRLWSDSHGLRPVQRWNKRRAILAHPADTERQRWCQGVTSSGEGVCVGLYNSMLAVCNFGSCAHSTVRLRLSTHSGVRHTVNTCSQDTSSIGYRIQTEC